MSKLKISQGIRTWMVNRVIIMKSLLLWMLEVHLDHVKVIEIQNYKYLLKSVL